MSADFLAALPYLLNHEGGYVNNPADKGGETYAGITASTAQGAGYTGTMNPIPAATVASIYLNNFWNPAGLDGAVNQAIGTALLDGAADGLGHLAQVAQNALTALGVANDGDGQWGPNTLAAVNSVDPDTFLAALSDAWIAWYQNIVANNASQQQFLAGWTNRANDLLGLQSGLTGTVNQAVNAATENPVTTSIIVGVIFLGLIFLTGKNG